MQDPNDDLAASVVAHLLDAGLIRSEDGTAVADALAGGKVAPDDWTAWVERAQEAKGA